MFKYEFIRENNLTPVELNFLQIVNSFSNECHLKLREIGRMMKRSERTARRTLYSLRAKGYIKCRYGLYKSIHLSIDNTSDFMWKTNQKIKKLWSKRPSMSVKSSMGVRSNIESNKERNKSIIYYNGEEETGKIAHNSGLIPVSGETLGLLNRLLGR